MRNLIVVLTLIFTSLTQTGCLTFFAYEGSAPVGMTGTKVKRLGIFNSADLNDFQFDGDMPAEGGKVFKKKIRVGSVKSNPEMDIFKDALGLGLRIAAGQVGIPVPATVQVPEVGPLPVVVPDSENNTP